MEFTSFQDRKHHDQSTVPATNELELSGLAQLLHCGQNLIPSGIGTDPSQILNPDRVSLL
jgi:hypothetical protein